MTDTAIRIIKLVISSFVFFFDRIANFLSASNINNSATFIILYYHAVYSEDNKAFIKQMENVLRHAKPVFLSDIGIIESAGHYCAVTFDDGFTCIAENALPEMAKLNIPATIFVPSACLGQQPPWLKDGHADWDNTIMTGLQLKNLNRNHVSIGSHGRYHCNLLNASEGDARAEIFQSKKELEDILKLPIDSISFPHGAFNQLHMNLAIEAGYRHAYSIMPELIRQNSGNFVKGRIKVDPSDWEIEYLLKILGAYRWLPKASYVKRKLFSLFN